MRFEGKVALVTGGASGIGAQVCRDFAREGAKVAILDVNEEKASSVVAQIQESGGVAKFFRADVSVESEVEAAVAATFDAFGGVDFLVNSAGVLADALLVKMTEEQWNHVIDVNLKGVFLVTRAVTRRWVDAARADRKEKIADYPDKRIVSISSMAAYGNMGQTNYAASKAGLLGLTKTWAKELIRFNVRTHAVMPTVIRTPITEELLTKDDGKWLRWYEQRIPLGIGKPEHVSGVILFLCAPESWFCNGQVIEINGGKLGEV